MYPRIRRQPLAAGVLRGSSLSSGSLGILGGDISDWLFGPDAASSAELPPDGGDTGGGVIEGRPETGWTDPRAGTPCAANSIYDTSGRCVVLSANMTQADCTNGFVWDPKQGNCVPPCPSGQVWRDGQGCMQVCPGDQVLTESGCVSQKDYLASAAKAAACPTGQKFDNKTMRCIAASISTGGTKTVAPKPGPTPPAAKAGMNPVMVGVGLLLVGVVVAVAVKKSKKGKKNKSSGYAHAA